METLSIIIPAKNEAELLPLLLDDIKRQTYQPLEVIVADAGSTDGTRELAQARGARVVAGGLPAVGRNLGAAEAKGTVLLFLDADVRLLDEAMLEKMMQQFSVRSLGVATVNVSILGNFFDHFAHSVFNAYVRLWGSKRPHAPGFCIMVRKELHDQVGGFDPTIKLAEDHDYAVRVGKIGSFGFLDGVTITTTTRRFEKEGRAVVAIKYVLAEVHQLLIGPIRHDLFKYEFGYTKEEVEKAKQRH
ncbi:glycosyltransferase [Patescibacteria group bacterium]|nr:glycosyltransferase [Patescibacteria group bacterium]